MTAASVVDVAVNPSNTDQRYALWGNGRIDPFGGAVPITGQDTWYDWIEQPIVVALWITNWSTGAGYVLDCYGGIHPLNGAPKLGNSEPSGTVVQGVPYTYPVRNYVDWAWNPNGSGQGYALSQYGHLHPFGGAVDPPRVGDLWTWPAARKLVMSWSPSVKGVIMDLYGGLHTEFNAAPGTGPNAAPYWPYWDAARDLAITNWDNLSGYTLDLYGMVHGWGLNPAVHGWPYQPGADVARKIELLSASDPIRFWEMWSGGQQYEFVSSTPPSVTAGGSNPVSPSSTVTTTSRPVLAWTYSDPQRDSQAAWELLLFTQAFVTAHSMANPAGWASSALAAASGVNRTTRGVTTPVDLPNGTYRFYVRAQDTAGQWSAWSSYGWTQNVPAPVTPTGLTATANQGAFTVALQVSATTGGTANLIRFEASDDAGATWAPVPLADAVPLAAVTTATDRFIPLGITRTYRAIAYATNPRVASAASATASATLTRLRYVLTALDNPTLGGEVRVQEPVEWTRPVVAGVFQGLGADFPTVVSDGAPKSRRSTLRVLTLDRSAWNLVAALVEADSTLLLRDPFGEARYCRVVGDWDRGLFLTGPQAGELTSVRHAHTTDLPLVEIAPPTGG